MVAGISAFHIYYVSQQKGGVFGALSSIPASFIVGIYCVLIILSVMILGVFHMYLVTVGQSTHEDIKKHFSDVSDNPYHKGYCGNFFSTLCGPRLPALIDFNEEIKPEEIRFESVVSYKDNEEESENTEKKERGDDEVVSLVV